MSSNLRSCRDKNGEPFLRGRLCRFFRQGERGNALLYVLVAVALLAALTYYFVQDSNDNYATQNSIHVAEELYAQVNTIRSAVLECTLEYPNGGPDVNGDGSISSSENPNNPYPINPSNTNVQYELAGCSATANATNCITASTNDDVTNLSCPGAGIGYEMLFNGSNNQGRYLPPMPTGFTEWTYSNTTSGIIIQTTVTSDLSTEDAANRLVAKLASGQASFTSGILKVYIKQ